MISLKNCNKIYDKTNKYAIKDCNIELPSKGLIAICGESGSGKSTFINCLSGLDEFTSGEIYLDSEKVNNLYDYSSYVFQEFKLIEELTVYDNLKMFNYEDEKIHQILNKLKIDEFINTKVSYLSGGQRARVGIARTLIHDSKIIFLDEPTANLDNETEKIIYDILSEYSKDKLILISSHQKEVLLSYSDNVINVREGIVSFNNSDKEINQFVKNDEISLKLNNKFKLALVNVKANIFKSIMTLIFSILSLTIIALMLDFILVDKASYMYKEYKINNAEYVSFDSNDSGWQKSVPNELLDELKPDCLEINLYFKANNSKLGSINFDKVVIDYSKSNSIDAYYKTKIDNIDYGSETYNVNYINSTENKLVISPDYYDVFKANIYANDIIILNFGSTYSRLDVENPYTYLDDELIYGSYPTNDNEITINIDLLNRYFDGVDQSLIGQKIVLNYGVDLSGTQITHGLGASKEYVISGISNYLIHYSDSEVINILSNYGANAFDNSYRTIKYYNYNKNVFEKCLVNNLAFTDPIGEEAIGIYNTIQNFMFLFWIVLGIFTLILGFSIFNCVNSSILKSRKTLGILTSYNVRRGSSLSVFVIELLILLIPGFIIGIGLYFGFVPIVNNIITDISKYYLYPLDYNVLIVLMALGILLIISILAIIIPFTKLMKKNIIDILYER